MRQISLFIFDLDGTLVDTLADIAASVNHALSQLGRDPISSDLVRRYVGDGAEKLMIRALEGATGRLDEAIRLYKEHYRDHLLVHSRLYPGVRETLEHFRPVPMAVISNKPGEFIGPVLGRLGIARYFERAIGADSGLPLKPAPDALQRTILDLGAAPDRTAIVGDGTADMQAGKAAGVVCCGAAYGFRPENELRAAGADCIIRNFRDLTALFQPA